MTLDTIHLTLCVFVCDSKTASLISDGLTEHIENLKEAIDNYQAEHVQHTQPVNYSLEDRMRQKGHKIEDYPDLLEEAEAILKKLSKEGTNSLDRDMKYVHANDAERAQNIAELKQVIKKISGEHRGQFAVPFEWARELIEDACKRDGNDGMSMTGIMKAIAI